MGKKKEAIKFIIIEFDSLFCVYKDNPYSTFIILAE